MFRKGVLYHPITDISHGHSNLKDQNLDNEKEKERKRIDILDKLKKLEQEARERENLCL